MSKAYNWCVTLFTYSEQTIELLQSSFDNERISRAVCQEEKAPETGRLHLQVYVCFKNQKRLSEVKLFFNDNTAHCEKAKGSHQQNYAYCTKEDTATGEFKVSLGEFPDRNQGRRTDLDEVKEEITNGKGISDIAENHFSSFVKYCNGISRAVDLFREKNAPAMFSRCCIVLWGRTGKGKSSWARQYCRAHEFSLYSKPPGRFDAPQWFDGYDGEQVLLLDDFEPSQVPYRELLVWLDVYKHRVQRKGGMLVATWHTVIITSNQDPRDWYGDRYTAEDREPLQRRLDHVFDVSNIAGYVSDSFGIQPIRQGRAPYDEERKGDEEGEDMGA